jgi:hypothetical protein
MLVVNAGLEGVTTAIVKSGVLLLHRTVDLGGEAGAGAVRAEAAPMAAAQEPADISIAAIAARLKALDARVRCSRRRRRRSAERTLGGMRWGRR